MKAEEVKVRPGYCIRGELVYNRDMENNKVIAYNYTKTFLRTGETFPLEVTTLKNHEASLQKSWGPDWKIEAVEITIPEHTAKYLRGNY